MTYGFNGEEIDTQIAKINVWFDLWGYKVWWVTLYDAEGNSIGESASAYRKSEAMATAKDAQKSLEEQQGQRPFIQVFDRNGNYQKEIV